MLKTPKLGNVTDLDSTLPHNLVFFPLILRLAFQTLKLSHIVIKHLPLHNPQSGSTPYG